MLGMGVPRGHHCGLSEKTLLEKGLEGEVAHGFGGTELWSHLGSAGVVLVSDSRGETAVGMKGPRNICTGAEAQSFRNIGGCSILKNEKWVTA